MPPDEPTQPTVRPSMSRIPRAFNGRLTLSVLLIALSQVNFGLDLGIFSGSQAFPAFARDFGALNATLDPPRHEVEPYFLSLLNSLPYVGFMLGMAQGSLVSARWGRRTTLQAMCVWAVVGATVCVTAESRVAVLLGRCIAYVYIGMEMAVVPVMQSEIVPPHVRGFIVATYHTGIGIGTLISALIVKGASEVQGDSSYRITFGCLYIIPCLIFPCLLFIPESPRWYLLKGREQDGLEALRKLRVGRFSDKEILEEFESYKSTISMSNGTFKETFEGANRRRTLIVIGTNMLLHLTGLSFITNYGTIFIQMQDAFNPFSIKIITSVLTVVECILSQFLVDFVGRRPLMLFGSIWQTLGLFCMGALGTVNNPPLSIRNGIIALMPLFQAGFNIGWGAHMHVVVAEIPTLRLRDKTYAMGAACNIAVQFLTSFSVPYLIYAQYAGLGSKVGFVFGGFCLLSVLFTWFFIPECTGKTLEEIDQLFIAGVSIRDFKSASLGGSMAGRQVGCSEDHDRPPGLELKRGVEEPRGSDLLKGGIASDVQPAR
ncbi:hypothetical protein MCOR27_002552 [Pyricularia oryzae]|nr:hypothetical protein MCOR27_002552 [Pyricularia oryzae]KAI6375500.1 hypothetical protein MCOR31_002168 [Pyricularia oryzae]KAI6392215.1 hypothetical protein MCOR24_009978 [Pyricularia oryzae]KAI6628659.1 hypothetical protein MCOR08_006642 [Pyricularia oryzae]